MKTPAEVLKRTHRFSKALFAAAALFVFCMQAGAQEKPAGSPFELGMNFSGITGGKNVGFGGGATWHFYRSSWCDVGLDGTYNMFLKQPSPGLYSGGLTTQGLLGIRAGFGDSQIGGFYIKARPGFVNSSNAIREATFTPTGNLMAGRTGSLTLPALDLGISVDDGLAWKHDQWSSRFDLGDTMVFQDSRFGTPAKVAHHFAYSVTVQYKF